MPTTDINVKTYIVQIKRNVITTKNTRGYMFIIAMLQYARHINDTKCVGE